ncbi:hypothetical protein Tco_0688169 [Tanacetum coccineum]
MAALVISISSDVSVESVGSSFPRVILIGSISVEVPVAPEVGAAAVASPVGVLELDTHSSSEVDPSESSLPPVSVAPMVSPFLCSDAIQSQILRYPRGMYHLHLMMLCLLDGGQDPDYHFITYNESKKKREEEMKVLEREKRERFVPFHALVILDFEPLSLSSSSLPSCDLMSLANILILCLILKALNQS